MNTVEIFSYAFQKLLGQYPLRELINEAEYIAGKHMETTYKYGVTEAALI